MPESEQHKAVKDILEAKLREWFGASVSEYPSWGHELDVVAVASNEVCIYVEVIWSHSIAQFRLDMNMLQNPDADVEVVIGSPEVIADKRMVREFAKNVILQRNAGKQIYGKMLDGIRILTDSNYVEN